MEGPVLREFKKFPLPMRLFIHAQIITIIIGITVMLAAFGEVPNYLELGDMVITSLTILNVSILFIYVLFFHSRKRWKNMGWPKRLVKLFTDPLVELLRRI